MMKSEMVSTTPVRVKTNHVSGIELWERLRGRVQKQIAGAFWLGYFLVSIAVIGFLAAYLLWIPLALASILFPGMRKVADDVLATAVALNLRIQPWLSVVNKIELPSLARGGKGLLIVANHRSHLDVFILLSRVPGVRILAKRSLYWIPFLNLLMWLTHQVPVARRDFTGFMKAMEIVRSHLRSGRVVHIFPEMTRCAPGFEGTLNFSVAPFQVAIQEKIAVLPVVFSDTDKAWPKGFRGVVFGNRVSAKSLPLVDPEKFQSSAALRDYVKAQIDGALA